MATRVGIILLVVLVLAGSAPSKEWKILDRSDGIEVALREEPDRNLPTMRGRSVLRGDIERLVAIFLDLERATEWAEGASKVTVLSKNDNQAIVHTHVELPWPVWDRDLVTSSKLITVDPGNEYVWAMTAVTGSVPEKEGVVRMKQSTTRFHMKKEGPGKVWVEYLVNVHPGGNIPDWLAQLKAESVPAQTLENLQELLDKPAKSAPEAPVSTPR